MSETLPEGWGTITPAMELELERALVWSRTTRLERMNNVLADCISLEELYMGWKYGDFAETTGAIKSKELVFIDLGDAGPFIPIWQFNSSDLAEGKCTIRPEIAKLWSVGNHNGLIFCQVMTREWRRTGKTPLELIDEGNDQIEEDIDHLFRYPPGM